MAAVIAGMESADMRFFRRLFRAFTTLPRHRSAYDTSAASRAGRPPVPSSTVPRPWPFGIGPALAERNSSPSWLMVAPTREDGALALTLPTALAGRGIRAPPAPRAGKRSPAHRSRDAVADSAVAAPS